MGAEVFRRRAVAVLFATVFGALVTARLGWWQLDRASQKIALQDELRARAALPVLPAWSLARTDAQARDQDYRRIRLQGHWMADATVYLDNRQMNGRPGFYVVTPLRLAPSNEVVLVQRGWAPRNSQDRTRLPPLATPVGLVTVEGHVAPPPSKLFDFGGAASGPIRQNLDLAAFGQEIGVRLAPLSVVQDQASEPDDGLRREWPHPAVDVQKHYGYAFQWFAMCVLMTGLYVWFQLVRPRLRRRA